MDRLRTRITGGSALWDDESPASIVQNNDFFGTASSLSKLWIKVSGLWKECITWIKVGGLWKTAQPNIKVAGVWKPS